MVLMNIFNSGVNKYYLIKKKMIFLTFVSVNKFTKFGLKEKGNHFLFFQKETKKERKGDMHHISYLYFTIKLYKSNIQQSQ